MVWCGDVMYIWIGNCWVYLVVVVDLFVCKVVGWVMLLLLDINLMLKVFEFVYESRGRLSGLMFYLD